MTERPTRTLSDALDELRSVAAAAGLDSEAAVVEGEALVEQEPNPAPPAPEPPAAVANAFAAINGGTVKNDSADVNTITTGTGAALRVTGTNIGAGGLTFRSISANGGKGNQAYNRAGAPSQYDRACGRVTANGTGTPR